MSNWEWNRNPSPLFRSLQQLGFGRKYFVIPQSQLLRSRQTLFGWACFSIVPEPAAQSAMMLNGEAQMHLWPFEFKADYDGFLTGARPSNISSAFWNMAIDFNPERAFDGGQLLQHHRDPWRSSCAAGDCQARSITKVAREDVLQRRR
ncbi:MAG: hypothetical protein IPO22_02420 [Anaerolineales bacterium]|nr:hypothetical protein [Anaerolineales bacterium]